MSLLIKTWRFIGSCWKNKYCVADRRSFYNERLLSGMEVSLVNAMSRETILRQYLDTVKRDYTHILIDCQPSLGMLTMVDRVKTRF